MKLQDVSLTHTLQRELDEIVKILLMVQFRSEKAT